MVGDDKASKVYVKNKSKACEEVGIEYEEHLLPAKTKMKELLELIEKLNNDETVHGILVQSPLPEGLDANIAFQAITPKKDVTKPITDGIIHTSWLSDGKGAQSVAKNYNSALAYGGGVIIVFGELKYPPKEKMMMKLKIKMKMIKVMK